MSRIIIAIILALVAWPADALLPTGTPGPVALPYSGVCDVSADPCSAAWGFRAQSLAIAQNGNAAFLWDCTNGGAQSGTVHVQSDGNLSASDLTALSSACGANQVTINTLCDQIANACGTAGSDFINTNGASFEPVFLASAGQGTTKPGMDTTTNGGRCLINRTSLASHTKPNSWFMVSYAYNNFTNNNHWDYWGNDTSVNGFDYILLMDQGFPSTGITFDNGSTYNPPNAIGLQLTPPAWARLMFQLLPSNGGALYLNASTGGASVSGTVTGGNTTTGSFPWIKWPHANTFATCNGNGSGNGTAARTINLEMQWWQSKDESGSAAAIDANAHAWWGI